MRHLNDFKQRTFRSNLLAVFLRPSWGTRVTFEDITIRIPHIWQELLAPGVSQRKQSTASYSPDFSPDFVPGNWMGTSIRGGHTERTYTCSWYQILLVYYYHPTRSTHLFIP